MYQAVLDITLQKSNGASKNWVLATTLMTDLDALENQVDIMIQKCERSYQNLPICEITAVIFDISNKVITHYMTIELADYPCNDSIATAQLANSTATKKDYSNLFSMYEYALIDMQKNNKGGI